MRAAPIRLAAPHVVRALRSAALCALYASGWAAAGQPCGGQGEAGHGGASLAIVDCNLLPMDGVDAVVRRGTLVVRDGVIQAMGPSAAVEVPPGAQVVQGGERWLLPGLTDMHVHLGHTSERLLYLRYGVTAVCNLGGDGLDLFSGERLDVLDLRRRIRAGELAGPDVYTTGTALDGDPATGPFQAPVADAAAAERLVRAQHAAGYDFVKVYDALTPAAHAAILRAAGEAGMAVFGHVPEALGLEATLRSGQRVIAHAEEYFGAFAPTASSPLDEVRRLARMTREAGAVVIPNVSFLRNVLQQLEDLPGRLARPEVRFVDPSVRRLWEPRYNYLLRRPDPEGFAFEMEEKLAFAQALTNALQAEGVLLLAGSDASVATQVPGLSLHAELSELVAAGLTPYEALRTATANVEAFFRDHASLASSFGTLRVGARANLLLVEGDPRDSLGSLADVAGVAVRGRWFTRAALDEALAASLAERER